MKEILYKYRERLINLSGRNRSLVSMTLPKKRAFDILKLSEIKEGIQQEMLQWLLTRDEKKLQLLEDSYVLLNHRKDELKKRMLQDKKREIEKLKEENLEKEIYEERLLRLEERLHKRLEQELAAINADGEKIIDFFISLKSLHKEINDLHKETGRYELYIGYPFIEGRFKDGTAVRAPLALFPVRLIRNGDQWYAENITERAVLLNKVFLLAFSKHNEIKLPAIDTEHEGIEEGFIAKVIQDLKAKNITINYEEGSPVKFIDYKKDTFPNYNFGELNAKHYIILGQFPISNSIYNDYLELEDMDFENELLEQLLKSNSEEVSIEAEQEEQGKLSFSEKDLFLVSSLDYSQEKAVQRVNETKQLVIYGPPGTGKSQTIANIIGDALAKNKTVLMVSQKRAALDVIYNRLAELNEKTVLIHDANGAKKNFYSLVAAALEEAETKDSRYIDEILKTAKEIDDKIELLESIGDILHSERSYGLTLQEMYSKTKAITGREDERYEDFNRFRKNNVFKEDTYQALKVAIDKIGIKELESFRQYDELRIKNAFIKDINPNMNFMDIDELVQKVQEIIIPVKNIISKGLEDKEVYDGLMSLFEKNSYSLRKEAAEAFAVELNRKHNGSLLDKLNTGRWWSIPYWLNYSKNKAMEEENKRQFYIKEQEYKDKIHKMHLSIKEAFEDILIVRKALNENAYSLVVKELLKGEDLTQYFMDIISALNQIEEYREDLITVSSLDKLQIRILEYASDKDFAVMKKRVDSLLEFVTLYNISEIEKEERVQKVIGFIDSFGTIVDAVKDNMAVKQKLSRDYVLSQWDNKVSSLKLENSKDFKEFKRQANKKSKLWPIREYLEQYSDMILKVFPCFLLSPETVSEVFPLKEKMFDVVIFDEASQMYVENSIPTIFRGKQVVIAGDDKQLRPSSTFTSRLNNEDDEMDMDNAAAMEEESLLDLAKVNYDSVHLNYHYRSEYDELINFSNYAFYGGSLQVSPNLRTSSEYGSPIERRMVNGRWINRSNQKEAEETVNIVAKLFKERKNKETIGIITFNINQKTLIEDMLEKRALEDEEFKKIYLEEIDREENNEDLSLFVKNIENVQGDERDIIIFSIAYAKNENGRVSVNFGSLSQDGGENRLNVAVSRAKKKAFAVTSIEPEELNVESSTHNGPRLFKKYLQYAREVSNGNKEAAQAVLNSVVDTGTSKKTERQHDSDFEIEVFEALVKKGYQVHTQVGVSGYKIDLAVYNPKTSSYILGIECDGATYHGSKSARERDIHRQRYLESRGWKIARIWSRNWWRNPQGEIERIEKILKGLS
jgi:very-short-patch-repair endonuclease